LLQCQYGLFFPGSKSESTVTDISEVRSTSDVKTLSSGIDIISDEAENRAHTVNSGE
jgi:hypothetical protein